MGYAQAQEERQIILIINFNEAITKLVNSLSFHSKINSKSLVLALPIGLSRVGGGAALLQASLTLEAVITEPLPTKLAGKKKR